MKTKVAEFLLEQAKYTIESIEERIKLGQIPVSAKMLLLPLISAIYRAENETADND